MAGESLILADLLTEGLGMFKLEVMLSSNLPVRDNSTGGAIANSPVNGDPSRNDRSLYLLYSDL